MYGIRRGRNKIIVLTLIFLLISSLQLIPITYAKKPLWGFIGAYVTYSKKVVVIQYPTANDYPGLKKKLWGYCYEEAKYVITSTSSDGFIMDKIILKQTIKTGGELTAKYLEIIDYGSIRTLRSGNTLKLLFKWVFPQIITADKKVFYNETIPWISHLSVYDGDSSKKEHLSKIIVLPDNIYGVSTVFRIMADAYYNSNGFLKKLNATLSIYEISLLAFIITLTIKLVDTNIHNIPATQGLSEETLYTIIAAVFVAGIIGFTIYYYRVRKELGFET